MLLKDQADISAKRPMPVDNVDDSSKVVTESGETIALNYYSTGTLTVDVGQAAGVNVIGKFAYSPILDGMGTKVANKGNSSVVFSCLALTTEKPFPFERLEQSLEATGSGLLDIVCTGFSNGDYTIDYRTGTIYGKKATTASTMTGVGYKRPSAGVTLDVGDISIGAVEIKDGTSDNRASVDATGALKVTGGASSVSAQYISPADFTATYTSASTITLTGVQPTIATGTQVVYIKVRNSSTNITTTYVAGANGYGFGHSAGVITAYLNGVATSIFTANDMYEVGINAQQKSYDATLDVDKTINQSPDRSSYVMDSLVDTTNVAAGTAYYPSSLGMSMDGFKDMSITGKIIEGDAVTDTISVEATNDEDQTNADWVAIYGYNGNTNAMTNLITTGGSAGTYTFALDYDNLNYAYYRVKLVTADSTNTVIIKMRRKSL